MPSTKNPEESSPSEVWDPDIFALKKVEAFEIFVACLLTIFRWSVELFQALILW